MPDERMTDAELDRLLAASSPYPTRDTALDARAEARLRALLAERPQRRRRRFAVSVSVPVLAAAVVALLVVLVVAPFSATSPAAADALRPLQLAASGLTVAEQVTRAQEQLADGSGPATPERRAVTVAWYAHVQMDGPDAGAVISPEVETWTWNEDFSANLRVTAGRAYTPAVDGSELPVRADLSPAGTVLRDDDFPASDFVVDGEPPPWMVAGDSADFYRTYLREAYTVAGEDPSAVLRAVGDLKAWWTLTDAQEANILEALRDYPGIELRGVTQDRGGRDVFALSAVTSAGLHEEMLLVSLDTGRIVGSETTYLGDDPEIPMAPNTVMSYRLWDLADG
ncbi:hypothetical protein [Microbacterium sp. RU33B]|uniref:hypothetical protein n=1 Tax=Microbacterium sp. RU33B TaxID=1907390 RepID=UPI0009690A84|nr:hypothetical protein [Microbacterium sp. RU33B]SIT71526.1 hypothetical protein SAMN05880545_0879 [Microbacterium sp. RU33B]